jgi:hypothetical protein
LRIAEFHYNPVNPSVADPQDLEYIEVFNPSAAAVSLDGVQITQFANTAYSFASGLVLGAGERIVVAKNPAVFQSVYGTGINIAPFGFPADSLSNGGERIVLLGAFGQIIQDFTFDDVAPWPTTADGGGPSLELIDPFADPANGANWRASSASGGSPGTAGGPVGTPGDFDNDDDVDGADFLAWQRGVRPSGATRYDGDADADGDADGADLGLWRSNFGPGASAFAVASGEIAIVPAASSTFFIAADAQPLAGRADLLATSSLGALPAGLEEGAVDSAQVGETTANAWSGADELGWQDLRELDYLPVISSGTETDDGPATDFAEEQWHAFEQALDATFARW